MGVVRQISPIQQLWYEKPLIQKMMARDIERAKKAIDQYKQKLRLQIKQSNEKHKS